MASRRSARVFLPLAREAARAVEFVSWNSGKQSIETKSLARGVDLAVRGARYETSNYTPKAWRGSHGRVPFVSVMGEHGPQIAQSTSRGGEAAVSTLAVSTHATPSTHAASVVKAATRPNASTRPKASTGLSFSTSPTMSADRLTNPAGVASEMTLPPLDQLRKLNPEMASIVEKHEEQRLRVVRVRDLVLQALETHVGTGTKLNKTALGKLKVNVLRDVLNEIGADARGNKASLVGRVLDEVRKDEENTKTENVAKDLGAGIASRKQVIKLQRSQSEAYRREAIAQTTSTLHAAGGAAQRDEASEEALSVQYTRVFGSPDDVAQILVSANAADVVMINVMGKCAFTDHMIIASAPSHQSVHRVAGAVLHELKQRCKEVAPGIAPSVEGADDPSPDWLVVDAGSIVVHVFHEESRGSYDLEGLWGAQDKSNVIRVAARKEKQTLATMQT